MKMNENEMNCAASDIRKPTGSEYVVEMRNITKEFGGINILEDLTLQLKKGEIHALLGENGAGKTTLMRVLFGMYQPDGGEIYINGQKVELKDPNDATALHIGMVHQHFQLVEVFTVLENIVLGAETVVHGLLSMDDARKKVTDLMERYGLHVDLDAKVEDINVGMQQRVEILKMLYRDNEVLIFDEPTAVLTPQETEELLQIMRNLSAEGKTLLFITHKLKEILAVTDRVTIIRKGRYIDCVETKNTTEDELSSLMVGRPVQLVVDKAKAQPGEVILDVKNMTVKAGSGAKAVRNVSFRVRRGEIVCIAGISGNGQTELVYGLTGLSHVSEGTIQVHGRDITGVSVAKKNQEMSCIPEDRHKHGLVLDFDMGQNAVLKRFQEPEFSSHGMIRFGKIAAYTRKLIEKFDIRCTKADKTKVGTMSGGNQQKAIIARELDLDKDLIIAVQPTRGVDVGAIEYIHRQLVTERDKGKAILLVSLELNEVMNLSDRILVMYEGEIVAELDPAATTYQEIGLYMAGAKRMNLTEGGQSNE